MGYFSGIENKILSSGLEKDKYGFTLPFKSRLRGLDDTGRNSADDGMVSVVQDCRPAYMAGVCVRLRLYGIVHLSKLPATFSQCLREKVRQGPLDT